ncbi:hypothetical protein TARUN_7294 [Trichoderma arundinaceum]|uniref:Uncharacterized protein n=1 Tax=Trichoderma arundinaceum TaxID=490622 RepID=A0A395NFQ1_TRIAR|nr:hypothetical protein TARUN_7294 [Trichoderma arundinaceum]
MGVVELASRPADCDGNLAGNPPLAIGSPAYPGLHEILIRWQAAPKPSCNVRQPRPHFTFGSTGNRVTGSNIAATHIQPSPPWPLGSVWSETLDPNSWPKQDKSRHLQPHRPRAAAVTHAGPITLSCGHIELHHTVLMPPQRLFGRGEAPAAPAEQ